MANAKGISLVDMVKYLRSRREEAIALLPERLRRYLDEKINIALWYPEEDMIGLVRVLVQLMPATSEPALRLIGRLNARHHVSGAYAHLFADADVPRLPLRARSLWKAMHDTGDLHMVVGDGEAEVEISGYGHPSAEMCEMIQPYLEELFFAAGVKKVRIVKRACCRAGGAACRYQVSWPPEADSI
ncbi:MAG TPA: hypothetical protein VII72_09750 [Myxococcota bacterium]